MEDLRGLVEGLGHHDVRTYVNSGNVVFSSDRTDASTFAEEIEDAVHGLVGFESLVVVRRTGEMGRLWRTTPSPTSRPSQGTCMCSS